MKLCSAVTFSLLFAVPSVLASRGLGQVNAPEGQGYGLGMHSCSEFARSYAANPSVTEDLYFTWAQGFMSGLNLMLQVNSSRARNLSHSGMISQTHTAMLIRWRSMRKRCLLFIRLFRSFRNKGYFGWRHTVHWHKSRLGTRHWTELCPGANQLTAPLKRSQAGKPLPTSSRTRPSHC